MDNAEENFVPSFEGGGEESILKYYLWTRRRNRTGAISKEKEIRIYIYRGVSMLFWAYLFARGRSGQRACAPSAMYTGTRKTSAGKREEIGEDLCARNTTNEQREFTGKNKRGRNSKRKDCRRSKTKRERELGRQGAYTVPTRVKDVCIRVCMCAWIRDEGRKKGRTEGRTKKAEKRERKIFGRKARNIIWRTKLHEE